MRKRSEAIRPLGDLPRKPVIEFFGKLDGFLALKLVCAWRDVHARFRQHLHRNAVAIHIGEPTADDVGHLVGSVGNDVGNIARGVRRYRGVMAAGQQQAEMFFKRDNAHLVSPPRLASCDAVV